MSDAVQIALIVCGAIVALAVIAALLYVWRSGESIASPTPRSFYTPSAPNFKSSTWTLDLSAIPEQDRAAVAKDWLAMHKPEDSPDAP